MSSHEDDYECSFAPEAGTKVDSKDELTRVIKPGNEFNLKIYPNPAYDIITIEWSGEHQQAADVSLQAIDGKQLYTRNYNFYGNEFLTIKTQNVPPGLYIIKVVTEESQYVSKVIIQK